MYSRSPNRTVQGLLTLALIVLVAAMAGSGLWILAHPVQVHAQVRGNPDFWFLNQTGFQIDRIYISPHDSQVWGPDLLGEGAVLANGVGVLVSFPVHSPCSLDFRLVFHDRHSETYTDGFNTCTLHAVIFTSGEARGY